MKKKTSTWSLIFCVALSLLVGGWWLYGRGVAQGQKLTIGEGGQPSGDSASNSSTPHRVMPGEFERQQGLLISWPSITHLVESNPSLDSDRKVFSALSRLFVEVISATHQRISVFCLVGDNQTRRHVEQLLHSAKIPLSSVQILPSLQTDLWTRDYGPITLKTSEGSYLIVDGHSTRGAMAPSSAVPAILAQRFKFKKERVPLTLEGGNLLSNGAGLCLTTTRLLDWNRYPQPLTVEAATTILRRHLGASQVVFLEPLANERTGHVDLFVTFTSPDQVVVAQVSSEDDPLNAKILDRNAERLSRVVSACGPLQVHRIPMPSRSDAPLACYTNVVYANGVLLVPRYRGVDPQIEDVVMRTYQELLPGWKIVGVDADVLEMHQGSLHCAINNLYRIGAGTTKNLLVRNQ